VDLHLSTDLICTIDALIYIYILENKYNFFVATLYPNTRLMENDIILIGKYDVLPYASSP